MITIRRSSSYADHLKNYTVMIDGVAAGKIADGEEKAFAIAAGEHTIYMKIDWCRSAKLKFVASQEDIRFVCSSNLRGIRMVMAIFFAFLFWWRYIKLERL